MQPVSSQFNLIIIIILTGIVLYITGFVINMTGFVLNMAGNVLNITEYEDCECLNHDRSARE